MKKKIATTFLVGILALCMSIMLAACGGGGVKITLNQSSVSLSVGGSSATISATVEGSDENLEWEIADSTIASITKLSKSCIVKPLAEGTTTLTAKIGDVTANCTVVVGAAVEVETVTIYKDGTALQNNADLSVTKGETLTLTATASKGSTVNWLSSNEAIATVENGVITAKTPGTTDITAFVTASIRATCTINVQAAEGSVYYELPFAAEGATEDSNGNNITQDMFFYWSAKAEWSQQEVTVAYAYYEDGVISFKYESDWDPGYSYGFQLMYKHSQQTIGSNYKLSCKITVDRDCFVNLNGNVIELKEGANDVVVYYTYTDPLGSGATYGISSFDLVMGYADGTATGYFVKDVTASISDIKWEDDVQEQLAAPSFTYDANSGKIAITDTNTEGVNNYRLDFYEGEIVKGSVVVENDAVVDTSRIPSGTYTVKLVAVSGNAHWIDSESSTSSATITVTNVGGISYTLDKNGGAADAMSNPGEWTYWTESWVTFAGNYANEKLSVSFSNNAGNWYDTQLFYQHPGATAGTAYKITFTITSSATGKITLAGQETTIQEGTYDYTVQITQGASGATVQIIFGTATQGANNQDIKEGTVDIKIASIEEVEVANEGVLVGGESDAVANNNTYYIWHDQNWCGTNVILSSATYENNALTFTYSGAGTACWFGLQIFYKNSELTSGSEYTVSFKINASVAGQITVNGQVQTLAVGENTISVTYTEVADKASLSIQFGVQTPASVIEGGTFTITDLAFSAT